MRELSLFSGAGGGLLGTHHLLNWSCCGYVEFNDYCQRVIAARIADGYLPAAPIFGDIRTFVSEGYAASYTGLVDVVSAGFPCQPFSVAGKQAGADDERNMWPATRDVIRIIRPGRCLLENVTGLLASGYCATIFGDLAALGYDAQWGVFSVAGAGGPHLRERIFIVADDRAQRISRNVQESLQRITGVPWGKDGGRAENWAERSGVSEPIIRRVGNGIPYFMDRLAAVGNAQSPAVVARAWEVLA